MSTTTAAEIVFDHVTKRYPGREQPALDDLSLEIPAGTFCVLVGPSGGGKTTALKMINRLIPFDSGEIRIDGRSILDLPLVELRRGIGYVIQQIGLFPHMTVGDNVGTVPGCSAGTSGGRARAARSCSSSSASKPASLAVPVAALGRPASARRPRARPRCRPAGAVDGRAVRGARPDHAPASADRAEAAAPRGRQDGDLRHARHRRGDHDGRPHRDPSAGRRARAVRHAGRDPRSPCRRLRRRSSSARTARCGGSRCGR